MTGAPQVSVVVPVKDRRAQMLRCLDALLAQDHPSFEVVVCDNGSTDGTADAVRERAAGAAVDVRVDVVGGTVGDVRNHGARMLARGEIVAFTDSDCLPQPDWLSAGAHAFADASVGIVQGTTVPEQAPDGPWPATIEVRELTGRYESCNLFVRREAFAATDGFASQYGWEDTAAGLAMLRAGWRATFAAEAVVRHDVTYPGFAWHLRSNQRAAQLAAVLARYPEMRDGFFLRVFFRPRDAKLALFVLGVAAAPRAPRALLLCLPYARERLRTPWRPRATAMTLLYDLSTLYAVARGAVRHRQLVL